MSGLIFRSSPLRAVACAAAILALAGCSFGREIALHAVDYNRTIEDAENRMFLLNVVRAYKGYPLHFTRIAEISGALEASGEVGASPPIGDDADDIFDLDLTLSGKSQPTFTIQVLDDQEFTQGVQSPIKPELFRLYHDQGWRMPVLLYALAERAKISFTAPGTTKAELQCIIPNVPGTPELQARFDALVHLLSQDNVEFVSRKGDTDDYGPALKADNIEDPTVFIELRKAGFGTKDEVGGRFRLTRTERISGFRLPSADAATEFIISQRRKGGPRSLCDATVLDGLRELLMHEPSPEYLDKESGEAAGTLSVEIALRSAQGVIFYLGELVRPMLEKGGDPVTTEALGKSLPQLFVLREGLVENPALAVRHEGTVYSIPRYPHGGRSMQLISLARQLFALHLRTEDAPSTQTVRFLN